MRKFVIGRAKVTETGSDMYLILTRRNCTVL